MEAKFMAINLSLGLQGEGGGLARMHTCSSTRRAIAPDAPLIFTNLLKYRYLQMETYYQTSSSGRKS